MKIKKRQRGVGITRLTATGLLPVPPNNEKEHADRCPINRKST